MDKWHLGPWCTLYAPAQLAWAAQEAGPAGSTGQDPQTHRAVDLAATHDVIQEGVDPVELPSNAVGKATHDPSPDPTPPRKLGLCQWEREPYWASLP